MTPSLPPDLQWKLLLGSFIHEFSRLEAHVFILCARAIGTDDTRKLTFGKRIDRIKASLKQESPAASEGMLALLREARGLAEFRNALLHNTAFHGMGGSAPKLEEMQARLQQLEALLDQLVLA
jgi:phytoene dehydrogenase-like protein